MRYLHTAYGMKMRSNFPIPGLEEIAANECQDIEICFGIQPSGDSIANFAETLYSSPSDSGERPSLVIKKLDEGAFFTFDYYDQTRFVVNREGSRIWCTWPATATIEDTATYLLGPILGFVLRLRRAICLHASVVGIDGSAICLLGGSGSGKSTTAAAFALRGFPVLSDDIAVLTVEQDNFHVRSAFPMIRLWPDSVAQLFGSPEALPRLTPVEGINWWWDKRYLSLNNQRVESLPLTAIYILKERKSDDTALSIQSCGRRETFLSLVANTFMNYALDKAGRSYDFEILGKLISKIPVRHIIPHSDLASLPDLCDLLLDDFYSMQRLAV